MTIDQRKIKILEAIINDYINTGEPVGSRTIAKKYDLGVGSATIRNEMSDLEDMGYLEQPQTSAGRVPSSKGYRLYVDNLMKQCSLTDEEEIHIRAIFMDQRGNEVRAAGIGTGPKQRSLHRSGNNAAHQRPHNGAGAAFCGIGKGGKIHMIQ